MVVVYESSSDSYLYLILLCDFIYLVEDFQKKIIISKLTEYQLHINCTEQKLAPVTRMMTFTQP